MTPSVSIETTTDMPAPRGFASPTIVPSDSSSTAVTSKPVTGHVAQPAFHATIAPRATTSSPPAVSAPECVIVSSLNVPLATSMESAVSGSVAHSPAPDPKSTA